MPPITAKFEIGPVANPRLIVDLSLAGGGVTGIFGPSGAGKTSLIRAIAGFEIPSSGYLQVGGQVWYDSSRSFVLPAWQRPLGYVFQDSCLFPHLTVERNLRYGFTRVRPQQDESVFDQMVDLFELRMLLSRMPGRLSGGEKQRVAFARAMLAAPEILLLDEPLASLDFRRRQEILPYLQRLAKTARIPILFISHALDELVQIADDLLLIENGRVVAHGALTELAASMTLAQSFFDEPGVVLAAEVIEHGDDDISVCAVAGKEGVTLFYLPRVELPAGSNLRLRIGARDVSISKEALVGSSVINQLPATVDSILPSKRNGEVIVQASVNGFVLLALITRRSQARLQIVPGQTIWLSIKATALK